MLFTHYIWDFDGTLFDTYPRMAHAFLDMLTAHGVHASYCEALGRMKRSVGRALDSYLDRLDQPKEILLKEFHQRDLAAGAVSIHPYPDTILLLRAIVRQGGFNHLYTHRDQSAMDALAAHGMADLFTDAITADDPFPPKPAPDALNALLRRNRIAPECAVMLGDRSIDVEAGHNAGIQGALFDPDGFYADYPTQYRAASMRSLGAILKVL